MSDKQLTFHNHPLKSDIVARWESGETSQSINAWLVAKHPDSILSIATLCKHHRNFKKRKDALPEVSIAKPSKATDSKIETILWATIADCQRYKQDATLSPKDWQYIDQQQQNALEKLIRIQDKSGDTRDISNVLTELFTKMELGFDVDVGEITKREVTEKEKLEITQEVDSEAKK